MNKVIISCVVFGYDEGVVKVLLTKKDIASNTKWGIVSGTIQNKESTDDAASRILYENGIEKKIILRQFKTLVNYESDLIKSFVNVGYYALINFNDYKINKGRSSTYKRWRSIEEAKDLVFGDNQMLDLAFYQFSRSIRELPFIYDLLPEKFTLHEFSNFWKQISEVEIDEKIFCKKMMQKRVLVLVDEKHNTSIEKCYRFNKSLYDKLLIENFAFYF